MRVLPTGNYYFLDFHVYNQCYSICSPTSLTPINISLGGVAFNLTRDNLFPNFEVWHLNRSPSPSPSTFYFSANELSQKLISNGIITPYDQICNLAIVITLSKEVTHDISLVDSYPNRTNIYEDDRITLENLTIFNDYCLAVPFQSSDYSNISYYKSNPSLFGTICDFSYFSSTGNQKLKVIIRLFRISSMLFLDSIKINGLLPQGTIFCHLNSVRPLFLPLTSPMSNKIWCLMSASQPALHCSFDKTTTMFLDPSRILSSTGQKSVYARAGHPHSSDPLSTCAW